MRSHDLSDCVHIDHDALLAATAAAWNRLDEERLKSIAATEWVRREFNRKRMMA